MSDRSRRELSERIDELEATLEELRRELGSRRGRDGVPRPPRSRELLRFADEYAIPAAIAALEANVRALELLRAGIRAGDPDRAVEDARGRASGIGRTSLDRLDRALADLESAIEGSGVPGDREARDLLADARRLNDEIRDAMGAGGTDRDGAVRIEVEDATNAGGDEQDVEEELESVKEEVASEEETEE